MVLGTGHLAVYLWQVSLPTDSQVLCLYKRKTGVYFCFSNIVTNKSVKRLFRNTLREQMCSLDSGTTGISKKEGKSKVLGFLRIEERPILNIADIHTFCHRCSLSG